MLPSSGRNVKDDREPTCLSLFELFSRLASLSRFLPEDESRIHLPKRCNFIIKATGKVQNNNFTHYVPPSETFKPCCSVYHPLIDLSCLNYKNEEIVHVYAG
jgi:hypothetical protein